MKILIIGDGSAGKRYEKLAKERGYDPLVLGPMNSQWDRFEHCEGVIIASPPTFHREHLQFSLNVTHRKGLPILCEGPVTYYQPHPAPNMTASNWRFVSRLRNLAAYVTGKQPVSAHFWFDWDLYQWRTGTPVKTSCYYQEGITNINLHEVDMALWMFGPAERVHVESRSTLKSLGMDAYSMIIKHHSGVLTTIQSGWHASEYQRGCVVQFRDGSREELVWKSPADDETINTSYGIVLDTWLDAIERWDLTVTPSLLDGYRAYQAINGVAY